ncbi:MAG: transglycosylase SLT domain-containing protein, partial [Gemmatimonadetes bacterium]|nr:transglycosylase SLT domain-containing protein [Gemmatimonadota bacterium]
MSRRILPVLVLLILVISVAPLLLRTGAEPRTPPPVERLAGEIGLPLPTESADPTAVSRAEQLLLEGRPWRAARLLQPYLASQPQPAPQSVLLAARAEGEWGDWQRTRALLEGRPWLDEEREGQGWFWLARALESDGEDASAASAYARYLASADAARDADRRAVAELRQGSVLLRLGQVQEGLAALGRAQEHAEEIALWTRLLGAEALARRGDTLRVRELAGDLESGVLGARARQARVRAQMEAGDAAGARSLALASRSAVAGDAARASLSLAAARAALALGDTAAARADLLAALTTAPGSGSALEAARQLTDLSRLSAPDRLALARTFGRHGERQRAAREYRAWLASGTGSAAERQAVRLDLGRTLFAAGEYAETEAALRELADAPPALASEALYLTGRAQFRRGQRSAAQSTFLRVAERFPRTQNGAEALYLVADLSHDAGELALARRTYRRVASDFPGTDRAGLALMRLAGMEYLAGNHAAAARTWEEYRSAYPRGRLWQQATYWAGRASEAAGDRETAAARYREALTHDRFSYYALRAGERLGTPFWPMPLAGSPVQSSVARARAEQALRPADLLRGAGLHAEAEAEIERRLASAGSDPAFLYPLAEALNERGYTRQGIRLGLQLQQAAGSTNARLLRILYPFPYRAMIEAEAEEKGLDPFLVAALTRQESMFVARIASPVGARGLMQVMPETGRLVAASAGIPRWDAELLYQPEVNVHLGTRYLAEQIRAYDGSLPSVFSAYNAGPHRVEQWKRFPEYGDEELFTERIPFQETRDYVKILTRNRELYRGLYGE